MLRNKIFWVALLGMLFFCHSVLLSQNNSVVRIEANQKILGDVLAEFQQKSHIRLVYANSLVDSFQVSCRIVAPPEVALRRILLGTPFDFIQQNENLWVVVPRTQTQNLPSSLVGQVVDAQSRRPVAGVNLYLTSTNLGTTTDETGRFILQPLSPGKHQILVERIGYRKQKLTVALRGNIRKETLIKLKPQPVTAPEIVVADTRPGHRQMIWLARQPIVKDQLNLPPLRNDGEIFEVLHLQPGVSRRDAEDVFPHLEGGSATEVLIELDGMPIYVPTYGFNKRSVFAAPMVDRMQLYRAGYEANYGGALSGVVAINSRDPWTVPFNLYGSVSLTGVTLGAKFKQSRLGWSGILRSARPKDGLNFQVLQSHDFFNKVEYKFSKNRRLTFLSLLSAGAFHQSNSHDPGTFLSHSTGIKYEHFTQNWHLTWLIYHASLEKLLQETGTRLEWSRFLNSNLDLQIGLQFSHLYSHHQVLLDSLNQYKFVREMFLPTPALKSTNYLQKLNLAVPYINFVFDKPFYQIQAGLRMPFSFSNEKANFEPRVRWTLKPLARAQISVSAGRYYQYTDRSYASEAKSGDAIGQGEYLSQVASTQPSRADHFRAEVTVQANRDWSLSVATFRKWYHFRNRVYLARINRQVWMIPLNQGFSRGLELWLGKTSGRSRGWVSFTWNRVTYKSDAGVAFKPYFNREKIFQAVFIHPLARHWQLKWHYARYSGYPYRNWQPDKLFLDPRMSPESFAEKYLTGNQNDGTRQQITLGLSWRFRGFARENILNLIVEHSLEEQNTSFFRNVALWASVNFAY